MPHDKLSWCQTAAGLLERGETARAKLVLETLLQKCSQDVGCYVLLVRACIEMGGGALHEALQATQVALEASRLRSDPGVPNQESIAYVARAVVLAHLARTHTMAAEERSKHRAEARQQLEQALCLDPGNAKAMYNLAVLLAEGGHYAAAMETARKALQMPHPDARRLALGLMALLLSSRQQLQEAVAILEYDPTADDEIQPAEPEQQPDGSPQGSPGVAACPPLRLDRCCSSHRALLLHIKAAALLALNDTNGALSVLANLRRQLAAAGADKELKAADRAAISKQLAKVWRAMALAYADQSQIEDAEICAAQLQRLHHWQADTHHTLGVVAEAAGDHNAAVRHLNVALSLDTTHAASLMSLGMLYRKRGTQTDLTVARGLLVDALRYDPSNHLGWYNLGLVCASMGNKEEAEQHLRTAVALSETAPVMGYSTLPLLL